MDHNINYDTKILLFSFRRLIFHSDRGGTESNNTGLRPNKNVVIQYKRFQCRRCQNMFQYPTAQMKPFPLKMLYDNYVCYYL